MQNLPCKFHPKCQIVAICFNQACKLSPYICTNNIVQHQGHLITSLEELTNQELILKLDLQQKQKQYESQYNYVKERQVKIKQEKQNITNELIQCLNNIYNSVEKDYREEAKVYQNQLEFLKIYQQIIEFLKTFKKTSNAQEEENTFFPLLSKKIDKLSKYLMIDKEKYIVQQEFNNLNLIQQYLAHCDEILNTESYNKNSSVMNQIQVDLQSFFQTTSNLQKKIQLEFNAYQQSEFCKDITLLIYNFNNNNYGIQQKSLNDNFWSEKFCLQLQRNKSKFNKDKLFIDKHIIEDESDIKQEIQEFYNFNDNVPTIELIFEFGNIKFPTLLEKSNFIQVNLMGKPNPNRKLLIVGITGPTRSGKGSLAQHLSVRYDTALIHGDYYFDKNKIYTQLSHNWDLPEALDWTSFENDIHHQIWLANQTKNVDLIVVESFILFKSEEIRKLCNIKIYLDISEDTMHKRRMDTTTVTEEYFKQCIVPNSQEYKQYISQFKDIHYIQGDIPPKFILDQVCDLIDQCLNL